MVWDIRHLQKANFRYTGIVQDYLSILGGQPAQFYTGLIQGFKDSIRDYRGWFRVDYASLGKGFISLAPGTAVALDENGNVPSEPIRVAFSSLSLGGGLVSPITGGTGYTYYEIAGPIFGVQPGQFITRYDRGILAEIFARDIENSAPFDMTARAVANLARIWGQYDPQ